MRKVIINNKEYDLVCTTAAYSTIVKKYGGIEEMAETFQGPEINEWDSDEEKQRKADLSASAANNIFEVIPWLVSILADQGTMLKLGKTKLEDDEKLTPEMVSLFTAPKDIGILSQDALGACADGFGMENKAPDVDPTLAAVEKQERKNAESAAE